MDEKIKIFPPFDEYVGKFVASLQNEKDRHIRLAASLISRNLRDGHVCLNLKEYAGKTLESDDTDCSLVCPELSNWLDSLEKNKNVGLPGEFKPLIWDGADRLYFHRYWQYENDIVRFIRKKLTFDPEIEMDKTTTEKKLRFYFPEINAQQIYWPAVAAISAYLRKFFVITGSPGTGKTTTVTRILAFLADCSQKNKRIALCAPTGKAAKRLEESVRKTKTAGDWPENVRKSIPDEAITVHRLLGSIRFSPYFQYHENNPLPYDIVVVDESSMVDLPLMAKLMTALTENVRLILLGDKDQLASVEAGAVLGSICFPERLNLFSKSFGKRVSEIYGKPLESDNISEGIQDCIVELKKNYRFQEESELNMISTAVKNGDADHVEIYMKDQYVSDIQFLSLQRTKKNIENMIENFAESYRPYIESIDSANGRIEDAFNVFEKFRVLCALRRGAWGVLQLNRLIEKKFSDKGLVSADSAYYSGKPVIVIKNDYAMNLFNGDIGIVLKDETDGNKLKVFFRSPKEGTKKIALERLPLHETAWAMTVHKSQGSEFDKVALILSDIDNPVLTRELVYTGITRARYCAQIWSDPNILLKSIKKRIIRHSGLAEALK